MVIGVGEDRSRSEADLAVVAAEHFVFSGPTLERIRGGMEARIQFDGLSPSDGAACSASFMMRWR
jgi:hypothetical protein